MSTTLLLLTQVVMMLLLSAIGYILFRTGKISRDGSRAIGNILIYVSLPCVIINSFLKERTPEMFSGLLISAIAAAAVLAVSMLISRLVFRKDGVAVFAGAFSNPGFFGVPLIIASLSSGAVFYIAAFIAFLNLLQWTWGVSLIAGAAGKITLKKVITAPFIIAILIGLFFFLTQIPLPSLVTSAITTLAGVNTPLAMFTVGIYLAQADAAHMFLKPKMYLISAVRLLVIPLSTVFLLLLVPASLADLRLAVLIASACPVGSNIAVYAQLYDADYPYAVETVVVSTLLSVITVPLIVQIAQMIWQLVS